MQLDDCKEDHTSTNSVLNEMNSSIKITHPVNSFNALLLQSISDVIEHVLRNDATQHLRSKGRLELILSSHRFGKQYNIYLVIITPSGQILSKKYVTSKLLNKNTNIVSNKHDAVRNIIC